MCPEAAVVAVRLLSLVYCLFCLVVFCRLSSDFLPLYRLKMGFVRRRSFTAAPVLIINCFASFVLIKNPGFALKIASLERDVVRREFYRENPIRFVLFARSIV